MPIYVFRHPSQEVQVEVFQKMDEPHVFVDDDGIEWERVWVAPNAAVDSQLDGTKESFMKYTENKRGTLGDLWDVSKECSEIRKKQSGGKDEVVDKHFKKYKEKNKINHMKDK